MTYLLGYTRKPIDNVYYDARLAYSLHLAVGLNSGDGTVFTALNHNSGVLFAKATENTDGSLNPKTIKEPVIFKLNANEAKKIYSEANSNSRNKNSGGNSGSYNFGVTALRFGGDGEEDLESSGKAFLFCTNDFLDYTDAKEITIEEYNRIKNENQTPASELEAAGKGIEGAVPQNIIPIPEEVYDRLVKKLGERVNCGIELITSGEGEPAEFGIAAAPENAETAPIAISCPEELADIKALAHYNDGTAAIKKIDWDLSSVDFSKKGEQILRGKVHQEHFDFPIARDRADPDVCFWNGKYYFIATNDADENHTLYIRESDTLKGLVNAPETLLLDSTTYKGIGGLLWAPEFHEINGQLYIFHAATPGEFFKEESHIMSLRKGGNPMNREDWSEPKRVCRKDGSDICEAGKEITLDMTCFEWQGEYYVIWSERQFLPKDLGAWLYIAKLNPEEPWKLLTDPVVLSKPDYGWANNHTFVDEGPFALIRGDRLFITFSSAAVDTSYVVGLLQIEKGRDLLNRQNWKKTGYPLLTSRSMPGEFGTGHNAYVIDPDGEIWNTYHARPGTDAPRSSGIRRVHFDIDGEPVLDLTEDRDLLPEFKDVEIKILIK